MLFIDDDPIIHEIIDYLLEDESDLKIQHFKDIPESKVSNINLICCDLQLELSNDEATLEKLRSAFKTEPLILMSGAEPPSLNELKSKYNIIEFLNKDNLLKNAKESILKHLKGIS